MMSQCFDFQTCCTLNVFSGGLFISRGKGIHPTRKIDSYELILVKQGVLKMWEEETEHFVKAGEILILRPNRWHGGLERYAEETMFYWIHFDVIQHPELDSRPDTLLSIPRHGAVTRPEKLEGLYRQYLDEQETGNLDPHTANALMMLMLVEVQRSQSPSEKVSPASILASRVQTYISLHYDMQISVSSVAGALGYNADYLGRVFRTTNGHTITEAINKKRIQVACRHLIESQKSIDEVAAISGFQEPDYFRRVFKNYMQITPSAFRKLYSRVPVNTL